MFKSEHRTVLHLISPAPARGVRVEVKTELDCTSTVMMAPSSINRYPVNQPNPLNRHTVNQPNPLNMVAGQPT